MFGPLTHAAVVNFQVKAGLVPDGWIGHQTATALGLGWPITPTPEDAAALKQGSEAKTVVAGALLSTEAEPEPRPAHADPLAIGRTAPVEFSFETIAGKLFAKTRSGDHFYVGYAVSYTDDMARRGLAQKNR